MALNDWLSKWRWLRRERPRSNASGLALALVHGASLTALLLVVLAAVVNQRLSPVYGWIEHTPLERVGAWVVTLVHRQKLFWQHRLAAAPLLKEEEEAREYLVREIMAARPSHVVILRNGAVLYGRLEEVEPGVLILTSDGVRGTEARRLPEAEILWSKKFVHPPVELQPADIRFLLHFPDFRYHYMPPYLIVSDAPYSYVEQTYMVLSRLHAEFRDAFRVLIRDRADSGLFYVCFFRDEQTYLEHAIEKEDVDLERSVGFYSPSENALFVYDRLRSFARNKIDRALARMTAELTADAAQASTDAVQMMTSEQRERAYYMLRRQMLATLRHEGAHQLAFSLQVHSAAGSEHLWVPEGLAQYCEEMPFGSPLPRHLRQLRDALERRELIPWPQLVDTPTPRGYSYYDTRADLAYAQAWFLFRHLMQPHYRMRFMEYLMRIRGLNSADRQRRRSEILEQSVGVSLLDLSLDLNQSILQASGPTGTRER